MAWTDITTWLATKLAGDKVLAADVNLLNSNLQSVYGNTEYLKDLDMGHPSAYYITSNYTILDNDGYILIIINASSADVDVYLPLKANNIKRKVGVLFAKDTTGTHKATIHPNASDANTLSGDGLASIILPKVGDFVEFVESQDTGMWEIVNERITSQVRFNTYIGYGSTDNKIPKFNAVTESVGNMVSHNHGSYGVHGLEITILKSGLYGAIFVGTFQDGTTLGITKNSAALTTSLSGISDYSIKLTQHITNAANYTGHASFKKWLNKNDVIRPHTSGVGGTSTSYGFLFEIAYLGQ